jgi:hypothetical protein
MLKVHDIVGGDGNNLLFLNSETFANFNERGVTNSMEQSPP